jgi:phenylacetate-coenzyme A ligase PaaK-like adenylate-forming protein
MHIDRLGELAKWLEGTEHRSLPDPTIGASLLTALNEIAGAISKGSNGRTGLIGTALFIWTLEEHARGSGALATFASLAAHMSPDRTRGATGLLKAIGEGRNKSEISDALVRASATEASSNYILDLVNLTLAYARRNCRRYSTDRFPKFIGSLDDFSYSVPTLHRREVEADFASICAREAPIDFYTATSGTSTGRRELVPHCKQEYAALGANATEEFARNVAQDSPSGMTLRLMPAGRVLIEPLGAGDTILATYDTNAVQENSSDLWDNIASQVFAEFPSAAGAKSIETIHSTPSFGLILLTKYMLGRGLDPKGSAVKTLFVTGSWIGPTTWRWLEEAWGAKLHTTYSCSELVGAAVACPRFRGRYHFGANLLAEVLDDAGKPVLHGEQGHIHMSGLYPYQRSAIFLRYQVGDWGRWRAAEICNCGLRGASIEVLGRSADVLTVTSSDGTRWPIPPIPTRNALDRFECVPKIPRPQYKLHVERNDEATTLWVDVECYALAGAEWQKRTRDAIADAILEEDESIRALVTAGELNLDVALFPRSSLTSTVRTR